MFLIAACAAIAAFSLWLRSGVPVWAIGGAGLDDALFVRLAYYLKAGLWLGPYDQFTLAKGMAYPAFIVAAFGTGIPLKITEHILYLAACAYSAWLVARLSRSHWLAATTVRVSRA